MKIKYFIGVSLVSMSLASQNSHAADWSGLYFGGHAGYSYFSLNNQERPESTEVEGMPRSVREFTEEPTGFSGGVQVGYQMQVGPLVAGVEGTYTALDIDDFGYTNLNNGTSTATAEISDLFAISARGGVAMGNLLAYGKAGYANAGIGYENMLLATADTLLNTEDRESGLLLGGGAEIAITENVSLGLDYTYINFDIDSSIQELSVAQLQSEIAEKDNSDHHQVNVRLNFRFN